MLENRDDVMVEYVVSDVSFALANATVKSLPYLRAFPKAYDLCRPLDEQGLSPCSFDMVVGLQVIHAVPDVESVLKSLHQVLVPGGSLLIVELDGSDWKHAPASLWGDMVFGGFSEWFGYTDGRDHPSIAPDGWDRLTRSVGFVDFQSATEVGGGTEFFFTAQKSPDQAPLFDTNALGCHFITYIFGEELELQEQFKTFDIYQDISIWILATDGIDGEAAQGLVKALSREYSNWDMHLGIFDKETDKPSRVNLITTYRASLAHDTVIHFKKDGIAYVPRVVPSVPPSLSNDLGPVDGDRISTSFLRDQQLLVDIRYWSESLSSYRGFSGTIIQSNCPTMEPSQRVVGIADHQGVTNKLICAAGSVMILNGDEEDVLFAECAVTSAIFTLLLGPARTADGTQDKPPLKVLIADEDATTVKLMRFRSTIPSLIQTRTTAVDIDEQFDVILTSSKELAKRPEIRVWHGALFVWDDVLGEVVSRDPWMLGHSIKTSLRLAKVDRLISESFTNTKMHSQLTVPSPLYQKAALLFSPSKAYLLVGGVSDLGVHLALWMYQVGGFLAPHTAGYRLKPFLAWRKEYRFDFSPWSQVPRNGRARSFETESCVHGTMRRPHRQIRSL